MPFPSAALSAANLVKLRGDATTNPRWYGNQYISLCPNTTILSGQVNGTPSGASFAQFAYDNASGSYASCKQDMTVLVSASNDRRAAYFAGRARIAPTATDVYINETSAPIADNHYFWIIDDYRIWDKLPREVSGTQYKDYDVSFRQILPVIRGLQTAYAGWCNSSNVLRLTLDASASYGATSGATISTYSWVVPAGTTYISGNSGTSSITIDVPHSTGDWIQLTITDSGSRVVARHIFVHAASDTYPPALGFTGAQIDGDWESGWNATIEGFSGIDSVLDHTFCVVWSQEWHNDTAGSIVNAVDFVGRLRQEGIETRADETYSAVQSVRYQIEGPAAQLARIEAPKLALRLAASPDEWDEITNLTIWRAIVHVLEHSTFLNLHDLVFHSTDNTFLYPALGVQGGDLFRCVNDLAESINAYLEFAPQGEARVMRSAWHLTTAGRNALVSYADWTTQDALDMALNVDPVITVGKVPTSGGYYDSTAGIETPLLALAPGVAQDIGTDEPQLTRQILAATSSQSTAQSELNTRAGNELEFRRGANTLTVPHPDGYHLLIPSRAVWYTWTIAATDNARGLAYTTATRWLIQRISIVHDNERGTRDVAVTYVQETTGTAGQTIQYPSSTEINPALPEIPPFDPYLAFPEFPQLYYADSPTVTDIVPSLDSGQIAKDGNVVVAGGADSGGDPRVILTKQFLLSANPPWKDKTPSDVGAWVIKHVVLDPFGAKLGCYVLASDGTDSKVWYTSNIDAGTPDWVTGASLVGVYTVLRTTSVAGTVLIYTPNSPATVPTAGSVTVTFDSGGYAHYTFPNDWATEGPTTVTPGGNPGNCAHAGPAYAGEGETTGVQVYITLPSVLTVTEVEYDIRKLQPVSGDPGQFVRLYDSSGAFITSYTPSFWEPGVWATTGTGVISVANVRYVEIRVGNTFANQIVEILIDNIVISYTVPTTDEGARVTASDDYGGTWAAQLSVGATPGATGGFDVQGVGGTVSLAAATGGQVKKATTFGGAYANEGAALADIAYVIIPWYQWSSDSTANTGSTPDYLIGLSTQSGGGSLFRDVGGARTDITPVVGGTDALFTSAHFATMWKSQRIACVGNISGTPHVFTSIDKGANWSDRGAVAGCTFILIRRRSAIPGQIYFNASSGVMKYMPRGFTAATIVSKTTPLSAIAAFDVWG